MKSLLSCVRKRCLKGTMQEREREGGRAGRGGEREGEEQNENRQGVKGTVACCQIYSPCTFDTAGSLRDARDQVYGPLIGGFCVSFPRGTSEMCVDCRPLPNRGASTPP